MEFIFRNTIIETTPAKNAEYYNNIPIIIDECSCDKCHNFVNGVGKLVPEISDFFAKIGIDIKNLNPYLRYIWRIMVVQYAIGHFTSCAAVLSKIVTINTA